MFSDYLSDETIDLVAVLEFRGKWFGCTARVQTAEVTLENTQ